MRRSPPPEPGPADRWTRLDELYAEARVLPVTERAIFLERACGSDSELHAELVSLLSYDAVGDALLPSMPSAGAGPDPALPAAAPDPMVGAMLHHYRVEARVGSGGMGVVYRARDTRLDRPVALKFIRPALSREAAGRQRILAEARAAAAIDHPNICTVYEVGDAGDGRFFIAMACYEGETLKAKLAGGRRPVGEAVALILQAAEGVRAAHQRGVVHQDIKPGNIFVTREGVVKLLDFGIARTEEAPLVASAPMVGTAAYTAPERVRGYAADARADVWSLGVVLYEMLAGRRPFGGSNPAAALRAVLYEDPPDLARLAVDVPPALEQVVARALAKEPESRQSSVEAFVTEIREAVADSLAATAEPASVAAHSSPAAAASRARVLAALLIAIAALGLLTWRVAGGLAEDRSGSAPAFTGVTLSGEQAVPRAWEGPEAAIGEPLHALATAVASPGVASSDIPPTRDIVAWELYHRANDPARLRSQAAAREGVELLRRATLLDPTFAAAWAALARLYLRAWNGRDPELPRTEGLRLAEEAATRALALDESLAEAHGILGVVRMRRFDLASAEASLRRAILLDPGRATFRERMVGLHNLSGKPGEALSEAERAVPVEPLSPSARAELARAYLVNGRCDEALAQLGGLLGLEPPLLRAGNIAAQCHAKHGRWDEALAELRQGGVERGPIGDALAAYLLARAGRGDEAIRALEGLLERARDGGSAFAVALAYAGLGDHDLAFEWLHRSVDDLSLRFDPGEPLLMQPHGLPGR